MKKRLISLILLGVVLWQPVSGAVYKIKTHVWIAQQVLNDVVPDGQVTIGQWEFPVDPRIVSALRNHPEKYRMGHVGPDGFPDIITGQLTTHPGVKGAWQTDDWLRWMLSGAGGDEEKIALAYGYLGHAADDVFAHTYVNMYSGDIFAFSDGEAKVEERHFALESYIESHTPPLRDHAGNAVGNPHESVSTPSRFVADQLILNDTVAEQYRRQVLTKHVAAMHRVRSSLKKAVDRTLKIDLGITGKVGEFENKLIDIGVEIDKLVNPINVAQEQLRLARLALKKYDDMIEAQQKIIDAQIRLIEGLQKLLRAGCKINFSDSDARRWHKPAA